MDDRPADAALAAPIPLDQLTWNLVDPLPWESVPGDPRVMAPGEVVTLDIPVAEGDGAALVRYTIETGTGTVETRVINEAELEFHLDLRRRRASISWCSAQTRAP